MDGNNNSNNPQYPYNPYYYPQYYTNYPLQQQPQQQQQQQHVPQGDPSAALSSMVYQLQQQTQQRQAMGALAAASISSVFGNNRQQEQYPEYYADYYAVHDQRSMINYNDITQANAAAAAAVATTSANPVVAVNENDPSPKKPKFCCNRWLKSAIAVAQHEKLHIQCPSCDHMCLKSALQEHEEITHGKERVETNKKPSRPDGIIPPNAPRIETPEELEAWIAARKKNWPTKNNVERKEQETAEKQARGELPTNKKRKLNDKTQKQQQQNKKSKPEESSLVAAQYDSNSDSDDLMDPERDAISSKDPSTMGKILLPQDRPKRRCKYFMMGTCKRGNECGFSHEKPDPKPKQPKQPRNAPVVKKRPNLLFKLLEKDIKQEKNVILQCLRYITDNNFFGKGEQESADVAVASEAAEAVVEEKLDSGIVEIKTDESLVKDVEQPDETAQQVDVSTKDITALEK